MLPLDQIIDPGWAQQLKPVRDQISAMGDFLRAESAAGRHFLPAGQNILRAFADPFEQVKVLIVGQDPYPTPGHAMGLSFSVQESIRPLPRSLQNIYKELATDIGCAPPSHGDLSGWSQQGVMLLNRVLTVSPGEPASHRSKGWEPVTDQAIKALATRNRGPLVAILWGRDAQATRQLLQGIPTIESVHPSPLSASRGFFGSRPFSKANQLLQAAGTTPIDWGRL